MASSSKSQIQRQCRFSHLLHPAQLRKLARDWLNEDTPSFDYGGHVVGDVDMEAVLVCKGSGVLAGVSFFEAVFHELECDVTWEAEFRDGDVIEPKMRLATVKGKIRNILLGERPALNCLSRCSGVATNSRRFADLAQKAGWKGQIAGTRKTTPGFRLVEKYGMLVGGVATHRFDLSSMVMLKDNHIWAAGNITKAVEAARSACGFSTKIEVECRSVDEAVEAVQAGSDCIMLDNFHPQALHTAAQQLRASSCLRSGSGGLIIEASGGITESNLNQYFGPDIDVISMGCISQGYPVIDLSLKVIVQGHDPLNPLVSK